MPFGVGKKPDIRQIQTFYKNVFMIFRKNFLGNNRHSFADKPSRFGVADNIHTFIIKEKCCFVNYFMEYN